MRLLDSACDGVNGTVARAKGAAAALVGVDGVFDQVGALARGTLFVLDVGFVLVAEVFDGG